MRAYLCFANFTTNLLDIFPSMYLRDVINVKLPQTWPFPVVSKYRIKLTNIYKS